ncbi:pre-mRNA-splicing factor nucampholin [Tachypleus tridentatus]|uniref:pre-mRNA-splicing factor nucampholin n=1 Tax=Tachypleus tridentatus TaxID=6853 RepID=UPI003FD497FE
MPRWTEARDLSPRSDRVVQSQSKRKRKKSSSSENAFSGSNDDSKFQGRKRPYTPPAASDEELHSSIQNSESDLVRNAPDQRRTKPREQKRNNLHEQKKDSESDEDHHLLLHPEDDNSFDIIKESAIRKEKQPEKTRSGEGNGEGDVSTLKRGNWKDNRHKDIDHSHRRNRYSPQNRKTGRSRLYEEYDRKRYGYRNREERRRDAQHLGRRYWQSDNGEENGRRRDGENLESGIVGQRYWGGDTENNAEKKKVGDKKGLRTDNRDEVSQVEKKDEDVPASLKNKSEQNYLTSRTAGAYIPPARLKMMQAQITDKSSIEYQRIAWEALKKSIIGLVNKVNVSNIGIIVRELFQENIIRGRGLLARSVIQAQAISPTFSHVYSAFVAVINSKFPQIGELIIRRLIIQFRRGFRRNDKHLSLSSSRFLGHLINQQVAHEVVALEMLTLLLETPTDDSVELAISFLKECGMMLSEVSPRGINAVFERLRNILHESQLDKRVQYMIEVMFAIRKDNFKDHPSRISELDLIEEEDQYTHLITLEEATNPEDLLNVFKFDPEYEANEEKYKTIKMNILGENASGSEDSDSGSESDEEDEDEEEEAEDTQIMDNTETNLIALRRTIYLTIQSSLDFEECAHKLLKLEFKPGQIVELCHMILDCCAQRRTYEKFYGLLAQRFCQLNKTYVEPIEEIFRGTYDTIHRFETNKLRNVAKFFAHLLYTDAINWMVLSHIRLNEEDTTSSSRIFIKILFQELGEFMGLPKLNERVKDPTLQEAFDGVFPRDNPRNTRFAINFFTSIGLGGLTDDLREHLKNMPKTSVVPASQVAGDKKGSSSSDGKTSSSSSSDSEGSSSSSESGEVSSGSESDVEASSSNCSSESGKKKQKSKKQGEFHKDGKQREKNKEKEKSPQKQSSLRRNLQDMQLENHSGKNYNELRELDGGLLKEKYRRQDKDVRNRRSESPQLRNYSEEVNPKSWDKANHRKEASKNHRSDRYEPVRRTEKSRRRSRSHSKEKRKR